MTGSTYREGRGYTREDWEAVSDNPEWTEEDFRNAKPFAEVFPDLAASMARAAPPKEAVSLPIDADVLAKLRASGEGWQGRVNAVLRAYVERGAA